MELVLAAVAVLAVAALVIGTVRGRVRVRQCCAVEPERDLRLRG